MNLMRDVAAALRLLTVLPVPGREGAHASRFMGLVGWVYAAVGLAAASLAVRLGATSGPKGLLVAAVVVVLWGLLSGAMHWDGLADSADGLGVRGDAARRLEVMHDSTIGSFGVFAIVSVAMLQVFAIAWVISAGAWWTLAAAPVVGRWGAGVALATRAPARADGLGARYGDRMSMGVFAVHVLTLAPLLAGSASGLPGRAIALACGVAFAILAPVPFARRFGGITGDVLGACIVLTEAFVLVAGALGGVRW